MTGAPRLAPALVDDFRASLARATLVLRVHTCHCVSEWVVDAPTPLPTSPLPPRAQVTSVYMHIGPAFVSWTLRWYPDAARFGGGLGDDGGGFMALVLQPIPVYGVADTFNEFRRPKRPKSSVLLLAI